MTVCRSQHARRHTACQRFCIFSDYSIAPGIARRFATASAMSGDHIPAAEWASRSQGMDVRPEDNSADYASSARQMAAAHACDAWLQMFIVQLTRVNASQSAILSLAPEHNSECDASDAMANTCGRRVRRDAKASPVASGVCRGRMRAGSSVEAAAKRGDEAKRVVAPSRRGIFADSRAGTHSSQPVRQSCIAKCLVPCCGHHGQHVGQLLA